MITSEFRALRKRLHKSPSQLAQLLGVSEQVLQSYETGDIPISPEHEGQLFFLLSRLRIDDIARLPCWKVKDCPKKTQLNCPAWEFQSGRLCWLINGTICEGNREKQWKEK